MDVIEQEAAFFKALTNPKRLEILDALRDHPLCVGEIIQKTHLPQANISQHLMVLRKANIVAVKKVGQKKFYHVRSPQLIHDTAMMVLNIRTHQK